MMSSLLAPRSAMNFTIGVVLLKFVITFSEFTTLGVFPSQTLAGEQNARTPCTCQTYNFAVGGYFMANKLGGSLEMIIFLYKEGFMEEPEEYEEGFTEAQKMEFERKLLDSAYDNTYRVLTDKVSVNELLDEKGMFGIVALLAGGND